MKERMMNGKSQLSKTVEKWVSFLKKQSANAETTNCAGENRKPRNK
jgi:hypothetical protein